MKESTSENVELRMVKRILSPRNWVIDKLGKLQLAGCIGSLGAIPSSQTRATFREQ